MHGHVALSALSWFSCSVARLFCARFRCSIPDTPIVKEEWLHESFAKGSIQVIRADGCCSVLIAALIPCLFRIPLRTS